VAGERAPRLTPLPSIVIVADEFADMIMQVGKKAEEMITRLAQNRNSKAEVVSNRKNCVVFLNHNSKRTFMKNWLQDSI
jgi:hypothetical protein